MRVGDGRESRIWLLVNENGRLVQMIKQMQKLQDVLDIRRHGADREVFVRMEEFFQHYRACCSGNCGRFVYSQWSARNTRPR